MEKCEYCKSNKVLCWNCSKRVIFSSGSIGHIYTCPKYRKCEDAPIFCSKRCHLESCPCLNKLDLDNGHQEN